MDAESNEWMLEGKNTREELNNSFKYRPRWLELASTVISALQHKPVA
jgi:hypothetical protein